MNVPVTLHDIPGQATPVAIEATDGPGSGGAYHRYEITGLEMIRNKSRVSNLIEPDPIFKTTILFQNGPIPETGHCGVTIEHLLSISGHRLECFQAGPFANENNALALAHIKEAIKLLNQRTVDRIARGVEGKEVK